MSFSFRTLGLPVTLRLKAFPLFGMGHNRLRSVLSKVGSEKGIWGFVILFESEGSLLIS